jgi:hypothetical protein
MPVKFYFEKRATEKLHSEMGMPAVVSYESLRHMLPDSALWPQSALWGMHDFTLEGAQSGNSFNQAVEENFGKVDSLRLWLSCAAVDKLPGVPRDVRGPEQEQDGSFALDEPPCLALAGVANV